MARALRAPVLDRASLQRTRDTRPQVGLPLAERLDNLQAAFAATGSLQGRRVAIVDDVVTTGSTVRAMRVRRCCEPGPPPSRSGAWREPRREAVTLGVTEKAETRAA